MHEADHHQWGAKGETSTKCADGGKVYPMEINSNEAVMACRFCFLLFHRRDDSLHVAARGSVNGPPSLQARWGSGNMLSMSSCQVQERFCS